MTTARKNWKVAWGAIRRLIRRMTYNWPQNKVVATQHYTRKHAEETGNLPISITIKSSRCWFDRNHWKDQSVRRWLKSAIRRQLP